MFGDRGFVFGLEAVEDVAGGLGVDALGGEQILDAQRHTFEHAVVSGSDFRVGRLGHLTRLIGGDGDIGIELVVSGLDGGDISIGGFERCELLGSDSIAQGFEAQTGKIGHG